MGTEGAVARQWRRAGGDEVADTRETGEGLEVSLGIPGFTGDSGILGLLPGRFATVRQVVEEPGGGGL